MIMTIVHVDLDGMTHSMCICMVIIVTMCVMTCVWIFIVVPDSEYFEHNGRKIYNYLMREVIFCKGMLCCSSSSTRTKVLAKIIYAHYGEDEGNSFSESELLMIEYHREDNRDKQRISYDLADDTNRTMRSKCKKIEYRSSIYAHSKKHCDGKFSSSKKIFDNKWHLILIEDTKKNYKHQSFIKKYKTDLI